MAKRSQRQSRDEFPDTESRYRQKNPRQTKLEIYPKTEAQRRLVNTIEVCDQVFVFGPAGTGKTFIPSAMAANMLDAKAVGRIVAVRPNVPAGPTLGLKPGTLEDKLAEWIAPMVEVFNRALGASHVQNLMKNQTIEFVPLETMRGRTFDHAFVLMDEAQNVTPEQMEMFMTRIGEHSKVVVNGDIAQSDLRGGHGSGLEHALRLAKSYAIPVGTVEFSVDDVVRSGTAAMWVKAIWANRKTRTGDDDQQQGDCSGLHRLLDVHDV